MAVFQPSISISVRPNADLSRRVIHIILVVALVATHFMLSPQRAEAATTGSTTEVATLLNTVDFVDLETDEVQSLFNNATGGTFTLSFDGAGPTDPIGYAAGLTDVNEVQSLYNDAAGGTFTVSFDGQGPTAAIAYDSAPGTLETALETGLSNIADVTVTGSGVVVDPWVITFLDPGSRDVPEVTTDDSGLTAGTSTIATTTEGNLSVETALEALSNIADVSVTGAGTSGSPWQITFLDPGAQDLPILTSDDADLVGGASTLAEVTPGLSAPIDAAGVTYLGDNLLVSDSEIDEESDIFDDVDLWEMTLGASVIATGLEPTPSGSPSAQPEPTGLAFNPIGDHVYISRDNAPSGVTDVTPGGDGVFGTGDDTSTFLRTRPVIPCVESVPLCIADPEDVAWDTVGAQLFIVAGIDNTLKNTLTAVKPGPNGVFDGLEDFGGDDVFVGTWSLPSIVVDAEGLGYRASSDTLLVADRNTHEIYEITKTGRLIRTIDIETAIGSAGLNPSDVVLAPPSGGGGGLNLYVTDRGLDNTSSSPAPRDGRMFELSTAFANLAPFVSAGPDKSIAISDPLTLTGDAYDDGQPTTGPLNHTWEKVSGPGTVSFGSPNSLSTTASFNAVGTYVLKLSSTDGALTSEDEVQVQVATDPPVNSAPTVSAGSDQVVTLPGGVFLGGSASDDGLPSPPGSLTIGWTKVSGPGTVVFSSPSSSSTTASFSTHGTYVLRLTADDGSLESSDTATITVKPSRVGDSNDEMFFYRDDGLFRFYDVKPTGHVGSPILAGDGYTKNWTAITAVQLD